MTSSHARPGHVAGRRPVARPGAAGRKPAPLPLALRFGILGLVVLLVAGLGAAVVHFVGGTVIAAFDQQADWRGGYTGQFLVKNDTKNELRTWTMEFDLPEGSKVLRHWGATMTAKGDKYVFERDGANLKRGEATRFQFIVQGAGKPTNCRLNDGPCDQGDDDAAPTTPGGLRVAGVSVSSVRLAWQPSTDNMAVSTYRVYMDGKLAASTSATSTTISRLNRGGRHEFVVSALDMNGNESARSGAVSAETRAATDSKAPSAPTRLAAGKVTTLSAAIRWKAATDNIGVVGYNVYEGGVVVGTSAKPGATIAGLSAGTAHSFRVTAFDAAENESRPSAPIKVTTAGFTTQTASKGTEATLATRPSRFGQPTTLRMAPREFEPATRQRAQGGAVRAQQAKLTQQVDQLSFLTQQVAQQAQVTQQLQQQAQQAKLQVDVAKQQAAQIELQLEQQAELAKFQIQQAEQQADQAEQQVVGVQQQAEQAAKLARQFQKDAQKATQRAQQAAEDAGQDFNAQVAAQQLIQQAVQAQQVAQQLGQQAAQAQAEVQQAQQQAQQARFQVEQARQQAGQARQQAGETRKQTEQQIELAEQQAKQAQQQADEAQRALDQALKALSDAQGGNADDSASGSGSGAAGSGNGAPGQPRLKVIDVTDSSVTLRWTAAGGAGVEGYDVLRDGVVVQRAGGSTTTTVVTGLGAESLFSFSVVARGQDGSRSKPSNVVKAVTVAAGLDDSATPANLHASCVTDHSVSLDWDAPADASDVVAYDVYAQGRKVASVRGTSATIDGFGPAESVQFVVKSRDSAGLNSPASSVATVTTLRVGEKPRKTGASADPTGEPTALMIGGVPDVAAVVADGRARKIYRFDESSHRRRQAEVHHAPAEAGLAV